MPNSQALVPCAIMRGGTSKGVFFREGDLPADPQKRDRVIMSIMGSPDPRQIDGLGGADHLTSKIAIVGPITHHDADVSYTFGQVGISEPYVSYSANCGNLSAAVGVFAIEEGMIPATEPVTRVRIFNTNTKQVFVSYVPVRSGAPEVDGSFAIGGVPGTAAEIRLDFSRTAGATTGRILPTGNARDELHIPELGRSIPVSFVDVAKATMYFHARDVGLRGTEGPGDFTPEVLQLFWAIRNAGAQRIGLSPGSRLPTPVSVASPASYIDFMSQREINAGEMSFVARRVVGPPPTLHKAFAATGAVCTAVASLIAGTVVHEVARTFEDGVVRIGHPTGVFLVRTARDRDGSVTEASYSRTARRLMQGFACVSKSLFA